MELSIEEKAKAYDEAIKKAEALYKEAQPMSGCNIILETIFPELKESEDERIRKALIKYFTEGSEYLCLIPYNKEQCVDWLEKQGKQKSDWSEEDERILKATINTVLISRNSCEEDDYVKDRFDDELKWLKSLKQRIGG